MAENTQLAEQPKRQVGPVQQVKLLLNEDTVKKRFTDVLGKKAPQFMAWLNYQRAKIRRRHDEKVSKRSSKKSEL